MCIRVYNYWFSLNNKIRNIVHHLYTVITKMP